MKEFEDKSILDQFKDNVNDAKDYFPYLNYKILHEKDEGVENDALDELLCHMQNVNSELQDIFHIMQDCFNNKKLA